MKQKILVLEANEIPLRVFREFASRNPQSTIAGVLDRETVIESWADDVAEDDLYPSQTWASLNTGRRYDEHRIRWYNDVKNFDDFFWHRLARGGATEWYGVQPDVWAFGKVIGGGLPVGCYGGSREVMGNIAPLGGVYQGGTLSGNPLATAAGLVMETDAYGRYHLAGVDVDSFTRGRNFIIKLDPATLPDGARVTTENPRVQRITQGLMNRLNFGVQMPEMTVPGKLMEIELGMLFTYLISYREGTKTVTKGIRVMEQPFVDFLRKAVSGGSVEGSPVHKLLGDDLAVLEKDFFAFDGWQ